MVILLTSGKIGGGVSQAPLLAVPPTVGLAGRIRRRAASVLRLGRGEERPRPSVHVISTKEPKPVCQICLGRIEAGSEYVECSSGRKFHSVCLARTGSCPFCARVVATMGMERTTRVQHRWRMVLVPMDASEPAPPPESLPHPPGRPCPQCGRHLQQDVSVCECGAILVERGGTFPCTFCGADVTEGGKCPECGQEFEMLGDPCPSCGKPLPLDASACQCGAVLADFCPECGAVLRESDVACANCGAVFELLGGREE